MGSVRCAPVSRVHTRFIAGMDSRMAGTLAHVSLEVGMCLHTSGRPAVDGFSGVQICASPAIILPRALHRQTRISYYFLLPLSPQQR